MNRIQARTRISAGMSRLLLVPLATLAIIAGLLAMHTFTGAESASVQAATSARVHEQIPAADGSPPPALRWQGPTKYIRRSVWEAAKARWACRIIPC